MQFLAPQPPFDLRFSYNQDGSIAADWLADESTGVANLFRLHLTLENVLFEQLCDHDSSTGITKVLTTSERTMDLKDLTPLARYSLRVTSENDYGSSDFSQQLDFDTRPSPPSPPRDISIEFAARPDDDSKVDGVLRWKAPCNRNGNFSNYVVALIGRSEEFSVSEATNSEEMTLRDLKRGFKYDVMIQANNSDFAGVASQLSFVAPSGSKSSIDPPILLFLSFLKFQFRSKKT